MPVWGDDNILKSYLMNKGDVEQGFAEAAGKGKKHRLAEAGTKALIDDAAARGESRRARLRSVR